MQEQRFGWEGAFWAAQGPSLSIPMQLLGVKPPKVTHVILALPNVSLIAATEGICIHFASVPSSRWLLAQQLSGVSAVLHGGALAGDTERWWEELDRPQTSPRSNPKKC